MAKITTTLVTGLRGSLGNMIVYQLNGQTIVRSRPRTRGARPSPAQAQQQNAFRNTTIAWGRLSPGQKQNWASLGTRLPDWEATRGGAALSGYQGFLSLNTVRVAFGLPILADAPAAPDLPPCLTPLIVTPTLGAGGVLTLTVAASGGEFACPVQIFAARPALPGSGAPPAREFVLLAALPTLPAGGADIGPAYAKKFRRIAPGAQIAVRVTPVSPTGFRGLTGAASGIVGA